jgi:hypothetical protein
LHPLSQHHHFALIQALEMRRAAEAPAEKRAAAVERQAEKFVRFWHKTGQVHFREEEEVLLPAYARHTRLDRDADVMRILADHAEIRAAVGDFEMRLAEKTPLKRKKWGGWGDFCTIMCGWRRTKCFRASKKCLAKSS